MVIEATQSHTEPIEVMEATETRVMRDSSTGHFLKGYSGNPSGRPPKGKSFAELARALPDRVKQELVDAMVKQAKSGKVNAFEAVRDTAEGKPRQTVVTIDDSVGDDLLEQLRLKLAAKHGVIVDAEYTELPPQG